MTVTDRDRAEAISCAKMMGFPFMAAEIADGAADESALVQAIVRTRLAAYEEAAKVCEENAKIFLWPEYATGRLLSSFRERSACRRCAQAIRQLGEQ